MISVMIGLDPAIRVSERKDVVRRKLEGQDVDGRVKPVHDGVARQALSLDG